MTNCQSVFCSDFIVARFKYLFNYKKQSLFLGRQFKPGVSFLNIYSYTLVVIFGLKARSHTSRARASGPFLLISNKNLLNHCFTDLTASGQSAGAIPDPVSISEVKPGNVLVCTASYAGRLESCWH